MARKYPVSRISHSYHWMFATKAACICMQDMGQRSQNPAIAKMLTQVSSVDTKYKLDLEKYKKWIADQGIDGPTLGAKILSNEDSFVTFVP